MKRIIAMLLAACGLSIGSMQAGAVATTWAFTGRITYTEGTWTDRLPLGTPFRILVSYDPRIDNALIATGEGGAGYRYTWAVPSLAYTVYAGSECNPCEPQRDPNFDPGASEIIIRDDYNGVDGITFVLRSAEGNSVNLLLRGPTTDIYSGSAIPAYPDPRLLAFDPAAASTVMAFEVCTPAGACASGSFDTLTVPTYGTNWVLTARDCYYIDTTTDLAWDARPNDCVNVVFNPNTGGPRTRSVYGRLDDSGGGAGFGEFSRMFSPSSPFSGASNGQPLGSAFGSVAFGGPVGLPVVKALSVPTTIARNNGNVQAYQQYRYDGTTPTTLPLVVDLTYGIADLSSPSEPEETGLRPGGATLSTVLAIVDGDRVSIPAVAGTPFGGIQCGAEATLAQPDGSAWPAGSILGTASYASADGERNPSATKQLSVTSCSQPGQPVALAPGQGFIVATSLQTPSRGRWTQSAAQPAADGYVDASHTLRVTFDPAAPPALVQQLADSIAPDCTDCSFTPEIVPVAIDVQPGSTDCINPRSNGVVPVAILGSQTLRAKDVRVDASLTLSTLGVRTRAGRPQCSISDVNFDGFPDLVCQFENAANAWSSGQTTAELRGKLLNGLPVAGTDTVCVK